MSQQTLINEACWCYGGAHAHKWYSPDVREHVAKITSSFSLDMLNVSTDTDNRSSVIFHISNKT